MNSVRWWIVLQDGTQPFELRAEHERPPRERYGLDWWSIPAASADEALQRSRWLCPDEDFGFEAAGVRAGALKVPGEDPAGALVVEPHVSVPALTFIHSWDRDARDESLHERLVPYMESAARISADPAADERRACLVTNWFLHSFGTAWLSAAGLQEQSEALRAIDPIAQRKDFQKNRRSMRKVKKAVRRAWAPVYRSAGGAGRGWQLPADWAWHPAMQAAERAVSIDSAAHAAREASLLGEGAATRAAAWWSRGRLFLAGWVDIWFLVEEPAQRAAEMVAYPAARHAAAEMPQGCESRMSGPVRRAAERALQPTVSELQESAFALLDRMMSVPQSR